MFEMSPRSMEALIGKQQTFSDGLKVDTRFIDPMEKDPNPSSAAIAEARHIALDPSNVKSASIDNEGGGETQVINFNGVQFAAHREGNSHDRMVSEYMGEDYDRNTQVANMILARKQREVIYIAGYLEKKKSISGGEAKEVIRRANQGETVEITITTPDGTRITRREKGVKGETVVFDAEALLQQNAGSTLGSEESSGGFLHQISRQIEDLTGKQDDDITSKEVDGVKSGTLFHSPTQSEPATDRSGSSDNSLGNEGGESRSGLIFQIPVQHEIPAEQLNGQINSVNSEGDYGGKITRLPVRSSSDIELTKVRKQLAELQEAA